MATFGGFLQMNGAYRFVRDGVVELSWSDNPSKEAEGVVDAINEHLEQTHAAPQVKIVRKSVMQVEVTATELTTIHVEKGRIGRFHRVQ